MALFEDLDEAHELSTFEKFVLSCSRDERKLSRAQLPTPQLLLCKQETLNHGLEHLTGNLIFLFAFSSTFLSSACARFETTSGGVSSARLRIGLPEC